MSALLEALRALKALRGMVIVSDEGRITIRHTQHIAVYDPLETVAAQHGFHVTRRGRDLETEPEYYVVLEKQR